jgi:hypothetical protein
MKSSSSPDPSFNEPFYLFETLSAWVFQHAFRRRRLRRMRLRRLRKRRINIPPFFFPRISFVRASNCSGENRESGAGQHRSAPKLTILPAVCCCRDDSTLTACGSEGKRCNRPLWFVCNEDIPLWALLKVGCILRAFRDALSIDRRFAPGRIGMPRET